ncbi:hypothetical protein Lal_00042226 [Lupinus albus]|nr:hypothetical protein Lal_00042226 [Lupinus albus]
MLWLILGDFNKIILPFEVKGGNFIQSKVAKFSQVLESCRLLDLRAIGSIFTWFRREKGGRSVSKRLDRTLSYCKLLESEIRLHFNINGALTFQKLMLKISRRCTLIIVLYWLHVVAWMRLCLIDHSESTLFGLLMSASILLSFRLGLMWLLL